jgi:hypothetical protein
MEMRIAIQAESKLSQIRQSPAKPGQRKSKKKAWISLDFLGGIEPFQSVMLTPRQKIFATLAPFARLTVPAFMSASHWRPPAAISERLDRTTSSVNRKDKSRRRLRPLSITY